MQTLLRDQAVHGEWRDALATLENNRGTGLFERKEFDEKKAVVLTALARDEADAKPEKARDHALAAHKLDPSLVPAAVLYARASSRLGDLRRSSKVLEATWKEQPHPDIADTYVHLRAGDATQDRLKRAENLAKAKGLSDETRIMLARAALDADEFDRARDELKPLLENRPTERVCLLMADIEEGQHGEGGRVREWLARALRAPRDPAWVADGVVSERWQPVSPVTGELGAFEWKQPAENPRALAGPAAARLEHGETPHLSPSLRTEDDDVEDAEVVEVSRPVPPAVKPEGFREGTVPEGRDVPPQGRGLPAEPSVEPAASAPAPARDKRDLPLAPVPENVKARPKQSATPTPVKVTPVAEADRSAAAEPKVTTPGKNDTAPKETEATGEPVKIKPDADVKVVEVQPAAKSDTDPKIALAATKTGGESRPGDTKPADTKVGGARSGDVLDHQPDDPGVEEKSA